MSLQINEIFHSIQGESLYAGRPCVFVRLTGCNLRCAYCDTTYAYHEGKWLSISEIITEIRKFPCRLVEVTGGEPLLQPQTPELVQRLLDGGYQVLVETNGSLDISRVAARCVKIMDVKCPTSGEREQNDLKNLNRLSPADQIKFVIGDREDFEFAHSLLHRIPDCLPQHHILFSPAYNTVAPHTLADWILTEQLSVRLHLQLHKIIWPTIQRGV